MSDRVLEACELCKAEEKVVSEVDGYIAAFFSHKEQNTTGFTTMMLFRRLVEKYNKIMRKLLPAVTTPHTLRHTFWHQHGKCGNELKALQHLMGHANITMTELHAHATFDSAQAEFFRLVSQRKKRFYYFTTFKAKNTSGFKKICISPLIDKMLAMPVDRLYRHIRSFEKIVKIS